MTDTESGRAIEVAERFADWLADEAELSQARRVAEFAAWPCGTARGARPVAAWCTHADARTAAVRTSQAALQAVSEVEGLLWKAEERAQCDLLREIFGPIPAAIPAVRSEWLSPIGTINQMAVGLYVDRAFDHMPILADALEDAGCTSTEILNHCRGETVHARGCWVVDLLLRKE